MLLYNQKEARTKNKKREVIKMRTYEEVSAIICSVPDEWAEKLFYWFTEWSFGCAPKARANYWLKKVGITEEEMWMWDAV
jgi:hypothetical protein